jgi:hypothetical protein
MYVLIRPSILLVLSTDGVNKDVFEILNTQAIRNNRISQPPNVITSINIIQNQKATFCKHISRVQFTQRDASFISFALTLSGLVCL